MTEQPAGSVRVSSHRRLRRLVMRVIALIVVLVLGAVVALVFMMRASLVDPDADVVVASMSQAATMERDQHGRVRIEAVTWLDAVAAQGVAHGQDRYFQMDLARRMVAGELAAMLGSNAIEIDEQMRVFQYRRVAEAMYESMPERHRLMLDRYTDGVNAGLQSLGGRPPEYWIVREVPEPWTAVDSLLVQFYFFVGLSFHREYEEAVGVMHAAMDPALVSFLTPRTSRWDRPMLGVTADDPTGGYMAAALPGPDVIDLRDGADDRTMRGLVTSGGRRPGSNNWAVSGERSVTGQALIANDPHLGLRVPTVWYDVELHWKTDDGDDRFVSGASAPGLPSVIIGTGTNIAWGVTNAYGDHEDLVIVEVDEQDGSRYRVGDGWESFTHHDEVIEVSRDEAHHVDVVTTRWGPVVGTDHLGRPLALHSTALDASMVTLDLFDLPHATTLEAGLDAGRRWWGPSQNLLVADDVGRIGWIVTGYLPERPDHDGSTPRSWADGTSAWAGPIDESLRPTLVDPEDGILFSANNRTTGADSASLLTSAWPLSYRVHRIHAMLGEQEQFEVTDLAAMQLDTVSVLHETMRSIVLEVIEEDDNDPIMSHIRRDVAAWNGKADADQIGFRLVVDMYSSLADRLMSPLVSACADFDAEFRYNWMLMDEALLRILEERPDHLLPPPANDWRGFLRAVVDDAVGRMGTTADPLSMSATWGDANVTRINHPLGPAIPLGGSLLNMGASGQPGWTSTVRVAAPDFGASMRMVTPANPDLDTGLIQIPCGQSGHFLSPHFDNLHGYWLIGRGLPLRPQAALHGCNVGPAN